MTFAATRSRLLGRATVVLLPVTLALGACGLVTGDSSLPGQGKRAPNDVSRMGRLPLTVPPEFGVRPEPGAEESSVVTLEEDTYTVETSAYSTGEAALLARADFERALPNIRGVLNRENAIFAGDPEFVDEILFAAEPEASRSEGEAAEAGSGETGDVIIRQEGDDEGMFDGIF